MDIETDHVAWMLGKERMEVILRFGFINDLNDIPLAGKKIDIKFNIRVTHAADAETVNIGRSAFTDLICDQLRQFQIGGSRCNTDYKRNILGLAGRFKFQRSNLSGIVVDLAQEITVLSGLMYTLPSV